MNIEGIDKISMSIVNNKKLMMQIMKTCGQAFKHGQVYFVKLNLTYNKKCTVWNIKNSSAMQILCEIILVLASRIQKSAISLISQNPNCLQNHFT